MSNAHAAPDLPALAEWIRRQPALAALPALAPAHWWLSRLQGGQSNPSWLLDTGAHRLVLRARPGRAAELLGSAHAVDREYRVLRALQGSAVPVPRVWALCEDESVIGAAFYLMDFLDGRIFRDAALPQLTPAEREAVHDAANATLAALHRLDIAACGLADYGARDGYFERLIGRWTRQYRASETEHIPAMERLIEWLPQHLPPAELRSELALVHGDFRIENLVFHAQEPRVIGVLDWELSTLGHPLSDLAYHCLAWHLPRGVLQGLAGLDLAALGLPSQRAYVQRYAQRTGRGELQPLWEHWPFYLACNLLRLTGILQGIARREMDGLAASSQAREIAGMRHAVAELGWALASGQRPAV